MTEQPQTSVFNFLFRIITNPKPSTKHKKKKLALGKRQKFAIGVALLSAGLFASEVTFNGYGIIFSFVLAVVTDVLLFWAIHEDLQDNFSPQVFILPLLYDVITLPSPRVSINKKNDL